MTHSDDEAKSNISGISSLISAKSNSKRKPGDDDASASGNGEAVKKKKRKKNSQDHDHGSGPPRIYLSERKQIEMALKNSKQDFDIFPRQKSSKSQEAKQERVSDPSSTEPTRPAKHKPEKETKRTIESQSRVKLEKKEKSSERSRLHTTPLASTPKKSQSKPSSKITNSTPKSSKITNLSQTPSSEGSPNTSILSSVSTSKKKGRGVNLSKRNAHGETKLHQAAIKGNLKETKKLIDLGIEIDAKDYAGWTALHEACNHDHTDIAEILLEAGANVNSTSDTFDTPLHDAAANHNEELIKILIRFGADENAKNQKRKTTFDVVQPEARDKYKFLVKTTIEKHGKEREIRMKRAQARVANNRKILTFGSSGYDQNNIFDEDSDEEDDENVSNFSSVQTPLSPMSTVSSSLPPQPTTTQASQSNTDELPPQTEEMGKTKKLKKSKDRKHHKKDLNKQSSNQQPTSTKTEATTTLSDISDDEKPALSEISDADSDHGITPPGTPPPPSSPKKIKVQSDHKSPRKHQKETKSSKKEQERRNEEERLEKQRLKEEKKKEEKRKKKAAEQKAAEEKAAEEARLEEERLEKEKREEEKRLEEEARLAEEEERRRLKELEELEENTRKAKAAEKERSIFDDDYQKKHKKKKKKKDKDRDKEDHHKHRDRNDHHQEQVSSEYENYQEKQPKQQTTAPTKIKPDKQTATAEPPSHQQPLTKTETHSTLEDEYKKSKKKKKKDRKDHHHRDHHKENKPEIKPCKVFDGGLDFGTNEKQTLTKKKDKKKTADAISQEGRSLKKHKSSERVRRDSQNGFVKPSDDKSQQPFGSPTRNKSTMQISHEKFLSTTATSSTIDTDKKLSDTHQSIHKLSPQKSSSNHILSDISSSDLDAAGGDGNHPLLSLHSSPTKSHKRRHSNAQRSILPTISHDDISKILKDPPGDTSVDVTKDLRKHSPKKSPRKPIDRAGITMVNGKKQDKPGGESMIKDVLSKQTSTQKEPTEQTTDRPPPPEHHYDNNYDEAKVGITTHESQLFHEFFNKPVTSIPPKLRSKWIQKLKTLQEPKPITKIENLPDKLNQLWNTTKLSNVPTVNPMEVNNLTDEEERCFARNRARTRFCKLNFTNPNPPRYYQDYLNYNQGYMLNDKIESRLSIPWVSHPGPQPLSEDCQALYDQQENERYQLRVQQAIERERLMLSCEQHMARLESRATLTKTNQDLPYSASSYLLLQDEHLINHYTMPETRQLKTAFENTLTVINAKKASQETPQESQNETDPTTSTTAAATSSSSSSSTLLTNNRPITSNQSTVAQPPASLTPPVTRRSAAKESNTLDDKNKFPTVNISCNITQFSNELVYSHLNEKAGSMDWAMVDVEDKFNKMREKLIKRQILQVDSLFQFQVYEWLLKRQEEEMEKRDDKGDRSKIISLTPSDISENDVSKVFVPDVENFDLIP